MSKINYPENDSLGNLVSKSIQDTSKNLNVVLNNCSFSVPSDFSHVNSLRDFQSRVSSHANELNKIANMIVGIDRSYAAILDSIDAMKDNLNIDAIEERERLIK